MHCDICGGQIPEGADKCPKCGGLVNKKQTKENITPNVAYILGLVAVALAAISFLASVVFYFKVSAAMDSEYSTFVSGEQYRWIIGEYDLWSRFSYYELWTTVSVSALMFCGGVVFLRNSSKPTFSNPAMVLSYALIALPATVSMSKKMYELTFWKVVIHAYPIFPVVGFVVICLCLWGALFRDPEGDAREQRNKLVARAEACGWISILASILLVVFEVSPLLFDIIQNMDVWLKTTCGAGRMTACVCGELAIITGLLAFGIIGIKHKDIVEMGGLQNDTGDKKDR